MKQYLFALAILAAASLALAAADKKDFQPLFNGKDLTGWKLRNPDARNTWTVRPGRYPQEHGRARAAWR